MSDKLVLVTFLPICSIIPDSSIESHLFSEEPQILLENLIFNDMVLFLLS